ncbi:MAG: CHAT domain-containing protein [Nostoc sp. EfeVER01]|uniref:CHAT domain-containing protein n=1 Tax=unclassified Nostoc TaxID=2593658 RepID=UPI002AD21F1C|nr:MULTISPECIES: CHAT domain-containing protein [unclassified Nostoc]MDZ7945737.1 CHAT domain-containing protein [Nostoc sp. EfeVER01]MDZ7994245.1 CHAT domain-containing protein [Nostoc sp. EspVER01]
MVKEQATQPQKILILAAIPHGLRLDKEMREVEECIRRAVRRDIFDVDIRTAVRPQDIRRAIAEEKPTIVHFCGHGLEDGSLLLEDNGGQNKVVPPEGLASLFELHADYVNCVLLNACHSVKSAEAISKYINYAIGMNQEIQDQSAIQFAQGFYDGLGYATSKIQDVFPRAFQEGLVAIKLESLSQAEIPVIKTRINIDKSQKPKEISLMEAISLIITALVAGAGAAAKDTAGTAVKDAYQGLKSLIKKKLEGDVLGQAMVDAKPEEIKQAEGLLKDKITKAGADQDQEIVKVAQDLLEKLKEQPGEQEIINQTQTNTVSGNTVSGNLNFSPVQQKN